MSSIVLKNVYKKYKNTPPVLSSFNLEIRNKEIVAILGPSGSGKTSLLRLIAGLDKVSKGEIFIDNKYINDINPKSRDIAMVFQEHSFYPHLNVYENIALPLKMRKFTKSQINDKVLDISKTLKLENHLYSNPANLSIGETQRIAIAKAIVQNPKSFLLDEPMANLDSFLKNDMKNLILNLKDNLQASFIYATCDHKEALSIADRIVVIKNGFIKQIDTPKDIYNSPQNLFVAEFIGNPKMNLIHGELKKMGDQIGISFNGNFISFDKSKIKQIKDNVSSSNNITLGIRPEHIKIINEAQTELNGAFKAIIKRINQIGSESFIEVETSNITLTLKTVNNLPLSPGNVINIGLYLKKAHVFDGETDEILTH